MPSRSLPSDSRRPGTSPAPSPGALARRPARLAGLLAIAVAACGGGGGGAPAPDAARPTLLGGDRPVQLEVPAGLDPARRYPLVLVLHGFGATGFVQEAYFGVRARVARGEVFALAPDGLANAAGKQFWNADPACCDFDGQAPDDSTYLAGLVTEALAAGWPIDPGQVYAIGHSNGGFMAFRLACDHADTFAAIVSLAGAASSMPASCHPSRPIDVLHLHGTADSMVPYAGGLGGGASPGAVASVARFAAYNGCGTTRTDQGTLDLDLAITGPETTVSPTDGCPPGGAADLWTLAGSEHVPSPSDDFEPRISAWMAAHHR